MKLDTSLLSDRFQLVTQFNTCSQGSLVRYPTLDSIMNITISTTPPYFLNTDQGLPFQMLTVLSFVNRIETKPVYAIYALFNNSTIFFRPLYFIAENITL